MAYATISKPSLHFNTKLYTGNATARSITGVGFQPDFCWFKNRDTSAWHNLYDAVRGTTKSLASNEANVEDTRTQGLTAFDSDGFTVGTDSNINGNTNKIVAWNWKANGAGSSNTDGSITSTVSANTTSGFSIVKWVGTGADATIGHGLGVTPSMIIFKNLSVDNSWIVWNNSFNARTRVKLETTDAENTSQTEFMNDTLPTSSLIYLGTDADTNGSGSNYIAYCFTDVKGFSKFSSYIGNGNTNGPFIYTGFKPAFFICKKSSGTSGWMMFDNTRRTFNMNQTWLYPNTDGSESTSSTVGMDFLSNGVKHRNNWGDANDSGATYIYMSFASEPLVANVGNSIPATAR